MLEILALTGEQRDFVESMYQDNANSRGMVMTNKQLRIRYGFHGKHMEKNVAWDGNDQVNSVLAVLIEELSLPIGEKPVNLIEHGVDDVFFGTVAKLAMRQRFVLFKGLTFQKLCLPGAFRPGDHHNKMLRPGLCVVHASPQYL